MTPETAETLMGRELSLVEACNLIWNAAESHTIGSHADFQQIHLDKDEVLSLVIPRIRVYHD